MNNIGNMTYQEKLAIIAGKGNASYTVKKEALDRITDKNLLSDLSIHANDEWIQLESAIKCGNIVLLGQLFENVNDESVKLEAAIEMKDEKKLAQLALSCNELFIGSMAIAHISNHRLLQILKEHCLYNRLKAEAAVKLGNKQEIHNLALEIPDEWIRYQLAAYINDKDILGELARHSKSKRVKNLAHEWITEVN